ncbi:MAG: tyrosine-type recombinase/integrase [Rhodospirillales bacterium]|nr:tyrosine-type recombinase/integrase [Rhodospirillales bacterium]
MTLRDAIESYVAWRRDHGAKFDTSAYVLHSFGRHVGESVDCGSVTAADVLGFLAGNGRLTRHRANKHGALSGFYRYAISRGLVARSPLPAPEDEPRTPRSAPPYVFSREELRRLFGAIEASRKRPTKLDADTLRALLLLLYGAGLRLGEAQRLTLDDADLAEAVLTIRNTKFFRTRLVPVGPQLVDALRTYVVGRLERPLQRRGASTLLANLDGTPLVKATVHDAFKRLLGAAGIRHDGNDGRRAPCCHSLRHAAAVHRLESWYRQGADVQRLLPALSTWLGHANLDGTRVYLTMTPELLQEASVRFDRHVNGGGHE